MVGDEISGIQCAQEAVRLDVLNVPLGRRSLEESPD